MPLLVRASACRIAFLILTAAGLPFGAAAQPDVLVRAHAHNDYEHPRPLLDALDHGFNSIEADVHLVDGELLVAHDPEDVRADRTLEGLYLEPLRARVRANGPSGGRVYADAPPLQLLVDIKTEAEPTYRALRALLRRYADILTISTDEAVVEGAVTVVLSGNRPRSLLRGTPIRFAAFDGRLDDLDDPDPLPPAFMPLVSSSWASITDWRGDGPLPDSARQALERAVAQTHAQGRRLRFWATPDDPRVWALLYEAGVDLLNADDLPGLRAFLLDRRR